MAISEEAKAVAVAVAGAQVHGTGGGGGGSGQGRVIKDKAVSDVRKFDKGENLWEDWAYD